MKKSKDIDTVRFLHELDAIKIDLDRINSMPNIGGVYFLCKNNSIIYIGQSDSMRSRIKEHIETKKFNQAFYLKYNGRIKKAFEKIFIQAFNPVLNKKSKPAKILLLGKISDEDINLNHERIHMEMQRLSLRPVDLSKKLRVSRQLTNYILYKGGRKYALRLARIFGCKPNDLIRRAKWN